MQKKEAPTYWATIYMAGSIEQAKTVCRRYCFDVGLCVTIEPTIYIYTGGEETGFRIGLINYPKFPSHPEKIEQHAMALAELLVEALAQDSFCVVTPENTVWKTRRKNQ